MRAADADGGGVDDPDGVEVVLAADQRAGVRDVAVGQGRLGAAQQRVVLERRARHGRLDLGQIASEAREERVLNLRQLHGHEGDSQDRS